MRFTAPIMMVLLVGSLLSLACQHCLARAAMGVGDSHVMDVAVEHGDHPGMDSGMHQEMGKDPCTVYCNCEDNYFSTDTGFSLKLALNRAVFESSQPSIHNYHEHYIPVGDRLFINGKPHIPDRACYLPLERNCVLLN